ncbi:unnamed protein product [Coregonus sp. 'balchen']|nr:unnamed protein product [Coregonus sp. 'balchen']
MTEEIRAENKIENYRGLPRRHYREATVFSNSDEAPINKKLPKELLLRIFSNLDVITLCRCAQVSKAAEFEGMSQCGRRIHENCRNIEVLNLNGCTKITDSTCLSLSKFCCKLRQLDLTSCVSVTNHSLKALSDGCSILETLNLSWCDQITRDGIEALARGCNSLRGLFLRGCTQQITDDGLVTLCRGCHKLQILCVSGCSNITDASLTALGLNCPRLKILEAARCSHVTDAGFTVLARVTDNTLVQLAIHCPHLQALSLSHCELITDDGIRALSSSVCGQERLTVVELDNCPLITDGTLEHLKNCHRLERIELYDCQQVTRAGIKRIRAHLPEIKVHAYFAPVTPPPLVHGGGHRLCRCCIIL